MRRTRTVQHLLDRLLVLAERNRIWRSISNAWTDGAEERRSDQQGVQMPGLQATQADNRAQKGLQDEKVTYIFGC